MLKGHSQIATIVLSIVNFHTWCARGPMNADPY